MLKRHVLKLIQESLKDFPSILINGARQVGKSTLVHSLQEEGIINHYLTLDDLGNLEAARNDPDGFINQFQGPLAIDEVQRAPDLMRAIKKNIDENKKPGRFLLTGSANVLAYPGINESLAGRVDIIPLEGLSLSESLGNPQAPTFIDDLFSQKNSTNLAQKWNKQLKEKPNLNKKDLLKIVFFGGYPDIAIKKDPRFCERWFSSYQATYIERDVRNLSNLLNIVSFAKLYKLLAFNTGKLVNYSELAIEAQLDHRTIIRYIEILELTFQLNILRPWYRNDRKKYVKSPKIYLNDSGQACYLHDIKNPEQLAAHPALGFIFETWLWAELRKLIALERSTGKEVDFLLTRGSQSWGIECKFSESVSKTDFKSLKEITELLPNTQGILFYTGKNLVPFSDKLLAVPITLLS